MLRWDSFEFAKNFFFSIIFFIGLFTHLGFTQDSRWTFNSLQDQYELMTQDLDEAGIPGFEADIILGPMKEIIDREGWLNQETPEELRKITVDFSFSLDVAEILAMIEKVESPDRIALAIQSLERTYSVLGSIESHQLSEVCSSLRQKADSEALYAYLAREYLGKTS